MQVAGVVAFTCAQSGTIVLHLFCKVNFPGDTVLTLVRRHFLSFLQAPRRIDELRVYHERNLPEVTTLSSMWLAEHTTHATPSLGEDHHPQSFGRFDKVLPSPGKVLFVGAAFSFPAPSVEQHSQNSCRSYTACAPLLEDQRPARTKKPSSRTSTILHTRVGVSAGRKRTGVSILCS